MATFEDQDLLWRGALAENLDRLALTAVQAGELDMALGAFEEAIGHYEAATAYRDGRDAGEALARCLVNRADVHMLTDPRLASADAERAAELVEGTENRVTRLRVLMARATVDRAVGRPGQALPPYGRSSPSPRATHLPRHGRVRRGRRRLRARSHRR
ncbi:hypothetical protein [Streptomyces goshikiensis]|uniref:hypothetical protein n=1 Tax=Streptomyces goshikiensis TaxID=1942 RepID=UPI0036AEB270